MTDLKHPNNPVVFLDIQIGLEIGKLHFEKLFKKFDVNRY